MNVARVFTGVLVLGLMSYMAIGQETSIYKWIDEEGVINYSGLPPDLETVERTDVRLKRTDRQALQSQLERKSDLDQAAMIRKQHAAGEAGEANQARQETAARRAENCRLAQERLTTYSEAQRLYKTTEDGERVYLSDEELDSTRADAIRAVSDWCGKS